MYQEYTEEFGRGTKRTEQSLLKQKRLMYQQEKRLRRLKRQCQILGGVAVVLGLILIGQSAVKHQPALTGGSGQDRADDQGQSQVVVGQTAPLDGQELYINGDGSGESIPADSLILVNLDNPLPADHRVQLHWLENGSCAVAEEMYDALRDMLTEGSSHGLEFVVASGYRSREYQDQLLSEDIQTAMEQYGLTWQEAYDKESLETMPGGYSEHETGLAVDVVSVDYQVLDRRQLDTPENQWLRENCSDYGFILRYPEGKEGITGISFEPWHFRYVGLDAAKEITRRGITLEEYLRD